jgi:hypothetical protein
MGAHRLAEMGKFESAWRHFRDRAQRKEERQHFGLAWSVLAAYFLAGSVFLRSFHEHGWLMRLFNWSALAFFVFGALAAYLAIAVAMRWPPHGPKKIDMDRVLNVERVYFPALTEFQAWETYMKSGQYVHADESVAALKEWIIESENQLVVLLGRNVADRYRMAADPMEIPPTWAQRHDWVGLWAAVQGRLIWIRNWLREQTDL